MENLKKLIEILTALGKFSKIGFVWKTSERKWLPLLPTEQRYHCCAFCRAVKESGNAAFLRCNRHHAEAAFSQAVKSRKPFWTDCHAGARELVLPVLAGSCRAAIFAGPFRSPEGARGAGKGFVSEYAELPATGTVDPETLPELLSKLVSGFEPGGWPRENLPLLPTLDFSRLDERICRAVMYLHKSFRQHITVGKLAADQSMSPSRLTHGFSREIGMPLQEYLQRLRVAEALQLIESTGLSIGEAARECGITDQSRLANLFRRYYHRPPSFFRTPPERE